MPKAKKEKAFKPFVGKIPQMNTQSEVAKIPPYEDEGVKFQGYSKEFDGKNWQLKKQQNDLLVMTLNITSSTIQQVIDTKYRYFTITAIRVRHNLLASGTQWPVEIRDAGAVVFPIWLTQNDTAQDIYIDLSTSPLKMYGYVQAQYSRGLLITQIIDVNIIGFYQE
jgi:hypothetical protein